jgi:hypothetical protein
VLALALLVSLSLQALLFFFFSPWAHQMLLIALLIAAALGANTLCDSARQQVSFRRTWGRFL